MTRPSNTAARRAEIVAALRAGMARKGYEATSVADIAAAARLAPGLVHYHFSSKLEVLLALLDDLGARHEARLGEALRDAGEAPVARLAAFIDFHLGLRAADPEALACWVALGGEALRDAKVRARYRRVVARWVGVLEGILEDGRRARAFKVTNVSAAACAVVSAIQGYFVLAAVDRTLIPRGTAAASVRKMAAGLLGLPRALTPRRLS